ncbi:MAG: hypothetical protein JW839_20180 [Candidatus Lokiarchaeota archaeon]|nr:hypothetical protein [Candidatus Lokiarchaeota archaeon]
MENGKQGEKPDSMPFWRGAFKAMDNLVQNVAASKAGGTTSPSKNGGSSDARIVSVPIDKDAIKKIAEEVASWKNPYDVAVWLFAEAEGRLADAYVTVLDGTSADVQVDAGKVVDVPNRDSTESLAKAIASRRPRLAEVHWFLAERRYIYEKVRAA